MLNNRMNENFRDFSSFRLFFLFILTILTLNLKIKHFDISKSFDQYFLGLKSNNFNKNYEEYSNLSKF